MTERQLEIGDIAEPSDVIGIHSTDLCEDGKTILRLYDLRDHRTGAESYVVGEIGNRNIRVVG